MTPRARAFRNPEIFAGGNVFDAESLLIGTSAAPGAARPEWSAGAEAGAPGRSDRRVRLAPVAELMKREQRYRVLLALADALAVVVALASAPALLGIRPNPVSFVGPVLIVVIAKIQGLYDRDDRVVRKSTFGEWRGILEASVVVSVVMAVSWRLQTDGGESGGLWFFLFLTVATAALMVVGRTLARTTARVVSPDDRCLIMGSTDAASELMSVLSDLRGVEVVGSLPMLRSGWTRPDLAQVIDQYHAHRLVLVPDSESAGDGIVQTIKNGKEIGVRLSIFPTILASIGRSTTFDDVNGLPLFGIAPFGLSRSSRALKRAFDVLAAAVLLILLSPLMALLALWIRIDSPGPALFRQIRIGRGGQPFRMVKFRSMVTDAESRKHDLLAQNEAGEGLFKIALDPRITRAGRRLREAHLDELPQLFNVLRGQMSLVGPRPLIEEEDALFCDGDRCRLWLTPGMTGPWQIRGPMAAPLPEMAKLDYLYISTWNLWRDIEILAKTATGIVKRKGY